MHTHTLLCCLQIPPFPARCSRRCFCCTSPRNAPPSSLWSSSAPLPACSVCSVLSAHPLSTWDLPHARCWLPTQYMHYERACAAMVEPPCLKAGATAGATFMPSHCRLPAATCPLHYGVSVRSPPRTPCPLCKRKCPPQPPQPPPRPTPPWQLQCPARATHHRPRTHGNTEGAHKHGVGGWVGGWVGGTSFTFH